MNGNVIPDMGPLWKGCLISKGVENHCTVRNFVKMQWPHPFPMGTHKQSSGLICGDTSCGYLEVWRKMGNFLKKGGRAALCDRASMVMIFETFLDAPSFPAISSILCAENTFHVYEISLTQRLRLQQGLIKSVCLSICLSLFSMLSLFSLLPLPKATNTCTRVYTPMHTFQWLCP